MLRVITVWLLGHEKRLGAGVQRLALLNHLYTLELADLARSNDAVARISSTLPNLTITQGRPLVVGLELPQDSSDAFRFDFTTLAPANPCPPETRLGVADSVVDNAQWTRLFPIGRAFRERSDGLVGTARHLLRNPVVELRVRVLPPPSGTRGGAAWPPGLKARERDVAQERRQPKRDERWNVGNDEPLTGNYFVSAYPPFSSWSPERVPAAHHVLGLRPSPSDADVPLGLYVHVPFCVKRCAYCYYLSYADRSAEQINAYLDAVRLELDLYRRAVALVDRVCSFVYFGGGTPSLLSPRQILRLLGDVNEAFPGPPGREVTFECAPQTVTPDKLDALRAAGVTRVSLGIQQLNDEVLRRNGRVHLERDVERAYAAIRHVGFDVVNTDLMVGLVGETQDTFDASLERVIAMAPESVTLYPLEIPRNTPLYRALRSGELEEDPASWAVKRSRMARGFARLERAGYTVRSAYAAVRDPQRHRFVYQDAQYHGADFIGLGVASFSYLAGVHYQNIANLDAYQTRLADNELPIARAYALNDDERVVRAFVLQLKLGAVSVGNARRTYGVDIRKRFAAPLREVTQLGWAHVDDDAVTLTREGLMRVDRIIPAFYRREHQAIRYW